MNKGKSWLSVLAILGLLLALVAACAPAAAPPKAGEPAKAAEPIKFGYVMGLTGAIAFAAADAKVAAEMAVDEINAKGGVLGRKLEVLYEDDSFKAEQTVLSVEKLITQDKVSAVLVFGGTPNALAAAEKTEKYQVPVIIVITGADEVTEKGYKYLFRVAMRTANYAETQMGFLKDLPEKPKSMAIMHENRSFGVPLAAMVKKQATDAGINVVTVEPYDSTAVDFKPMLGKVKSLNPDVGFFVSYLTDGLLLMRQAKELDWNPKVYLGSAAGFISEDFTKELGKDAEGVTTLAAWLPISKTAGTKEFDAEFLKRSKKHPDHQGAFSHAAIYVLADAIKRAGSTDPTKMRDAVAKTELDTLVGRVSFDETGQNRVKLFIAQVQGGQLVPVWPKEQATAQLKYPTPPWKQR